MLGEGERTGRTRCLKVGETASHNDGAACCRVLARPPQACLTNPSPLARFPEHGPAHPQYEMGEESIVRHQDVLEAQLSAGVC